MWEFKQRLNRFVKEEVIVQKRKLLASQQHTIVHSVTLFYGLFSPQSKRTSRVQTDLTGTFSVRGSSDKVLTVICVPFHWIILQLYIYLGGSHGSMQTTVGLYFPSQLFQ